jgi:hypothetical protein
MLGFGQAPKKFLREGENSIGKRFASLPLLAALGSSILRCFHALFIFDGHGLIGRSQRGLARAPSYLATNMALTYSTL